MITLPGLHTWGVSLLRCHFTSIVELALLGFIVCMYVSVFTSVRTYRGSGVVVLCYVGVCCASCRHAQCNSISRTDPAVGCGWRTGPD